MLLCVCFWCPDQGHCEREVDALLGASPGDLYTEPMTDDSAPLGALATERSTESNAIYAALITGGIGAIFGLTVYLLTQQDMPLWGNWSLATVTSLGAAVVAAVTAALGYWRSRTLPGQSWRLDLPRWSEIINTVSTVLVHVGISTITVIAVFLVLDLGFIDWVVNGFWGIVIAALAFGLTGYLVTLSATHMTTGRMSKLLMIFVIIGTVTSMLTTPDPHWWQLHFSQLGTFLDVSSFVFNGTLIAGGLLVTTFSVYIAQDLQHVAAQGAVAPRVPRIVSTLFGIMGVMLACVGVIPVNVSLILHNLAATGMAVMFGVLLIGGFWWLRRFPRTYAISAAAFLVTLVLTAVLFGSGFFTLTALEIIAFALIFGWIAVFIRFLLVAGSTQRAGARS